MKINSKSRTRRIIAFTWIIPFIVASPFVFCRSYAFTIHSEYGSISREICNDRFDEIDAILLDNDLTQLGTFRKGYFIFLFFVIYLIPSAVILITCVKIAISLLQPINVETSAFGRKDTSRRQEENKRKVRVMYIKNNIDNNDQSTEYDFKILVNFRHCRLWHNRTLYFNI